MTKSMNGKPPRSPGMSNSFSVAEVGCLLELHRCVMRGGDARTIAASQPATALMRKFQSMHNKRAAAAIGEAAE